MSLSGSWMGCQFLAVWLVATTLAVSALQIRSDNSDDPLAIDKALTWQAYAAKHGNGIWKQTKKSVLEKNVDTDQAYHVVAQLRSDAAMEDFVRRLLLVHGKTVNDEGELKGFVPWFSGTKDTQSLMQLKQQLFEKPWVVDALDRPGKPQHRALSALDVIDPKSPHANEIETSDADVPGGVKDRLETVAATVATKASQLMTRFFHVSAHQDNATAAAKTGTEEKRNENGNSTFKATAKTRPGCNARCFGGKKSDALWMAHRCKARYCEGCQACEPFKNKQALEVEKRAATANNKEKSPEKNGDKINKKGKKTGKKRAPWEAAALREKEVSPAIHQHAPLSQFVYNYKHNGSTRLNQSDIEVKSWEPLETDHVKHDEELKGLLQDERTEHDEVAHRPETEEEANAKAKAKAEEELNLAGEEEATAKAQEETDTKENINESLEAERANHDEGMKEALYAQRTQEEIPLAREDKETLNFGIETLLNSQSQIVTDISSKIAQLQAKVGNKAANHLKLLNELSGAYQRQLDEQHTNTTSLRQKNKQIEEEIKALVVSNAQLRQKAETLRQQSLALRQQVMAASSNLTLAQEFAAKPLTDDSKGGLELLEDLRKNESELINARAHIQALAELGGSNPMALLQYEDDAEPVDLVHALQNTFSDLSVQENASMTAVEQDFQQSFIQEAMIQESLLAEQRALLGKKDEQVVLRSKLASAVESAEKLVLYLSKRLTGLRSYANRLSSQ